MPELSAAHRALTIEELLRPIFESLTVKDNASNARVCKAWSSVALDIVWKDTTLSRFGHLLRQSNLHDGEQYDWVRFDHYAHRARSLRVMIPRSIRAIATTLTRPIPLPNLRHLFIVDPLPRFLQDSQYTSVEELTVLVRSAMIDTIPRPLIPRLKKLKLLALPTISERDVFSVLTMFQSFSALEDLSIRGGPMVLPPYSPPSYFPHLRRFASNMCFGDCLTFIARMDAKSLQTLYIVSNKPDIPPRFGQLIKLISASYPLLACLQLFSPTDRPFSHLGHSIAFDVLEPILSLSGLKTLEIACYAPIRLEENQFFSIFEALPSLVHFTLSAPERQPWAKISYLESIIPYALNLESLHLELDMLTPADATSAATARAGLSIVPFHRLRGLVISTASRYVAEDAEYEATAIALSRILPHGCTIATRSALSSLKEKLSLLRGIRAHVQTNP